MAQSVDVVEAARKNIGIPYKFGGTTPQTGFDCSGLVCWSYAQAGIQVPRTARDQFNFGQRVQKTELKPGDIVVFKGMRSRTGWHSGIYTGQGMFIHSPNKGKTVMESSLDNQYFAKRFAGASRVPRDGSEATLYAAYQESQRLAANNRRPARKTAPPKTGRNDSMLAGSGKSRESDSAKSAAAATSQKTQDSTPLRAAVAMSGLSGQPGGKQADAVVDKLRSAKGQAPAGRAQAGRSPTRQPHPSVGG